MPLYGIPRTSAPESAPFGPAPSVGPRDARDPRGAGVSDAGTGGLLDGRLPATPARPSRTDRAPASRPSLLDRTARPAAVGLPGVPDVAPSFTDPELWGLLTAEERVFFRKPGADPALTYSRTTTRKRPEPPKILGARLDLRV